MRVKVNGRLQHYRTVSFDAQKNEVLLIEQRLLPHEFKVVAMRDYKETARGIKDMIVRGAGAIGATAAYGLAQGALAFRGKNPKMFQRHVQEVFRTLESARPTAVDPVNAMKQVLAAMHRSGRGAKDATGIEEMQALALAAAEEFAHEDVQHCQAIGRHGERLIKNGMRVLTHCNAGWLAFVDVGSATAPMYAAQAAGKQFHVFCDETRPRCQGATLTAWELAQQGISHQVIADNAAGHLMQRGLIDLVIVGSDRTLGRTGEVANKIGTYTKAVLAARHKIPFYVAIPLSTIDWDMKSGRDIPIEEREEAEVLGGFGMPALPSKKVAARRGAVPSAVSRTLPGKGKRTYVRIANPGSGAMNPGFDVTPAELITGIITPAGIFKPGELWRKRNELQKARG